MEVLRGPSAAFTIEPAYVRDSAVGAQDSRLFPGSDGERGIGSGSRIDTPDEVSSASSSSIGTPSDDDDDGGNDSSFNCDEVESKFRGGSFSMASLSSLEEALPIKRGLSTHFAGKSKSFASLADVVTVSDLKKTENPLNKRRRLVIASKWAKKSFYSFANPKSMPLLALQENDDDDDDSDDFDNDDEDSSEKSDREDNHHHHHHNHNNQNNNHDQRLGKLYDKRFKSFKTRCFSLADLQEHSVLEDDDDHH